MCTPLRTFSLGLICSLLFASSDAAVNGGRSIVAAQNVSSVSPSSYQTPDPGQGGSAVSSPLNTGHGNTNVYSSASGSGSHSQTQTKTCLWSAFQSVSGIKTRVTLKFDWAQSGSLSVDALERNDRASASSDLRIDYTTNNGGSWTNQVSVSYSRTVLSGNSDYVPISDSGSVSVDLPNPGAIDISQIRVRDNIATSATTSSSLASATATADVTMSISNIRLEVETMSCIASVPTDHWKGEYYDNTTNLSGSPAMVRDDGTVLNFNWGDGGPGGCVLGVDNFSVRWTRTVNFGPGLYRFSVTGDDGVRLYVDGQVKIDKWFIQAATTYTADVAFNSAGPHQVKLEYFENSGAAVASLSWAAVTDPVVSCLPDVLIGNTPRSGGMENIATTAVSRATKPCGQKKSD